jgi:hypothetical protein
VVREPQKLKGENMPGSLENHKEEMLDPNQEILVGLNVLDNSWDNKVYLETKVVRKATGFATTRYDSVGSLDELESFLDL